MPLPPPDPDTLFADLLQALPSETVTMARECKAFVRATKVTTPQQLLHVVLLYPRYRSASRLRWQAAAGTLGGTSSTALRRHWRGTGRPRQGLRHGHPAVSCRTRSSSHPCGSIMAGVHGCPRGGAPMQPHPAMRDTPLVAYGRSNDILAPSFLGM